MGRGQECNNSICFDIIICYSFFFKTFFFFLFQTFIRLLLLKEHPFGCCLLVVFRKYCVVHALTYLPFFFKAKEKRGWTLNSAGYLLGPRKSSTLSCIISKLIFFCCKTFYCRMLLTFLMTTLNLQKPGPCLVIYYVPIIELCCLRQKMFSKEESCCETLYPGTHLVTLCATDLKFSYCKELPTLFLGSVFVFFLLFLLSFLVCLWF